MLPYLEQPVWQLGPLSIHAFGVAVAAAFWFGMVAVQRRYTRLGLDPVLGDRLGRWILVGGIVGAHLLSVLLYFPDKLRDDPWLLLRVWEDISSFGGILGGVYGALLYFALRARDADRRTKLAYLDAIAFVFPAALAIGRIGCALAHDHPGTVTTFPLAISLESRAALEYIGVVYGAAGLQLPAAAPLTGFHDLGLYELLFLALFVVPLFALWDRRQRPVGFFLTMLAATYLPVRFALDMLRVADARYVGLTPAQWVAALVMAALPFIVLRRRKLRLALTGAVILAAGWACTVSPQSQPVVRADTTAPLAPAELSCEYRWSAPQDLLSFDGRPTYVETPTAAVTDTGLLLVGTPSFFWATRTAFDPPPGPTSADTAEYYDRLRTNHSNVGMSLDARMRARGVHFPARPGGLVERAAIVADSAGGVHLYYATRPEDSVAIWHTRLYGTLWSVPRRLLTEGELYWPWGEVRAARGGDMHLAVAFFRAGTGARSGSGVAYLRHGGGDTRVVLHFQRGRPSYASLLPYGDSLLIAFNGVDPAGRGGNGSHVFLIRASVHDSVFPPARRLHWSGARVASWPRLFLDSSAASGRQLGVLWASAAQGEAVEAADSLHAMVSRDGVAWGPPESVELPQPARHMSVVSSTGLGIHGVTHPQKEGERATYFHWRGGAWRRLEVLPFAGIASLPSLMHVRRDSLLLMWGVARSYPGAPPEAPRAPVSRFAWLGSSCTY